MTEKAKTEEVDHSVKVPSGKTVDISRSVVGVGHTYEDGTALNDEDRKFVSDEIAKRAKAKP